MTEKNLEERCEFRIRHKIKSLKVAYPFSCGLYGVDLACDCPDDKHECLIYMKQEEYLKK